MKPIAKPEEVISLDKVTEIFQILESRGYVGEVRFIVYSKPVLVHLDQSMKLTELEDFLQRERSTQPR